MPDSRTGIVHLVDDDAAVRESLQMLLEANGLAVRTYGSGTGFLETVSDATSGCVITDVRMPGLDGIALQRALSARRVALPVIVMTGHADVPLAVQALKAGAADFLEKPFDEARLLGAVRGALQSSATARRSAEAAADIRARLATLTPKEREVMESLVAGHPNKVIAHELGSSPRTVEVHRGRVMEKMAARSLPELVRMAIALESGALPSGRQT